MGGDGNQSRVGSRPTAGAVSPSSAFLVVSNAAFGIFRSSSKKVRKDGGRLRLCLMDWVPH